jgi:thiol-disulfide isomerase/thioredoxin
LILVTILAIGLTGCAPIMMSMFGFKMPKPLNEKDIYKLAEKYKVPLADCYDLDTNYIWYFKTVDTTRLKENIKNHLQPMQALYYKNTGYLQSFHVNCWASGFPNLRWDRDSILATFPPLEQAPIDSILPLDSLLKYMKPLSQTQKFAVSDYDYIVVIFWNRWIGKQSKRLIHFIQENCKLAKNEKVKIIYVNNDNFFANGYNKEVEENRKKSGK